MVLHIISEECISRNISFNEVSYNLKHPPIKLGTLRGFIMKNGSPTHSFSTNDDGSLRVIVNKMSDNILISGNVDYESGEMKFEWTEVPDNISVVANYLSDFNDFN